MKRLLIVFSVMAVVVLAAVAPAAATPVDELTGLAQYFPEGTLFYATVRTDDAYIETLDGLVARVGAALPNGMGAMIPSLGDALDMAAAQFGGDFATVFRTWLGDKAAFGVDNVEVLLDNNPRNDNTAYFLVVEITDGAAAAAYIRQIAPQNAIVSDQDGFTRVEIPVNLTNREILTIDIYADSIFISQNPDRNFGTVESSLLTSESFSTAVNALPLGDYNILLYVDTGAIYDLMMGMMMGSMGSSNPAMAQFEALAGAVGPMAVGFTILDDVSLTVDAVQVLSDLSALGPASALITDAAIDPQFMQYIPYGTPVVSVLTNLNGLYNAAIDAVQQAAAMNGEAAREELKRGLEQVNFAVRGLTGLDLERDIFRWMTGEVALYVTTSPRLGDATSIMSAVMSGLPVDFGLIIDATADPAAAAKFVDGLASGVEFLATQTGGQAQIAIAESSIGGASGYTVTITSSELPFPVELAFAANDQVFAFGTSRAVLAAMQPGETLLDDPQFTQAGKYIYNGSYQVHYLSGVPLVPVINLLASDPMMSGSGSQAEQLALVGVVLGLLNSSSISAAYDAETGISYTRAVLSLPPG